MTPKQTVIGLILPVTVLSLFLGGTSLFAESIVIPATSLVSPAFIEGGNIEGQSISATVDGVSHKVHELSATDFYINAPLEKSGSSAVIITAGGAQTTGAITWTPIDIDGKSHGVDVYNIRQDDSLLLESSHGTALSIGISSGVSSTESIVAGQPKVVRFPVAGIYRVAASDGSPLGDISVRVFTLAIDPSLRHDHIASEVGHTRTFDVPVTPAAFASTLFFTTASPTALTVTTGAVTSDGINVSFDPLKNVKTKASARINSATGPVIGSVTIDAFTIDRTGMLDAGIVDFDPITGDSLAKADIIIAPIVRGLSFHFQMFAHTSTFLTGATSFDVDTDGDKSSVGDPGFKEFIDPITGIRSGKFTYTIVSPRGEDSYCHTVTSIQK